jgi:hypothetical protein
MAYQNIDRVNGRIIRKLISPDRSKSFGFISGKPADPTQPNGNLLEVERHSCLTEARSFCGFQPAQVATPTLPKSAYAQNRKGYKADANASRKGA